MEEELPRKPHVHLTAQKRLELLRDDEQGKGEDYLAEKYNVHPTTVRRLLLNKERVQDSLANLHQKSQRVSLLPIDKHTEELKTRIRQETAMNNCISLHALWQFAQAQEAYKTPPGQVPLEITFYQVYNWCRKHNIRTRTRHGELASCDLEAAKDFQQKFAETIANYSAELVFNADETGLAYKVLGRNTLVLPGEPAPPGRKQRKDRMSVMVCANMAGTVRIPLSYITRPGQGQVLHGGQHQFITSAGWQTNDSFCWWVREVFYPVALQKLEQVGGPGILLILDNHKSHAPPASRKKRSVLPTLKFLRYSFFPANTSALIQPMDQGVIHALKARYRSKLQESYAMHRTGAVPTNEDTFLQGVTPNYAAQLLRVIWSAQIEPSTLANAWRRLSGSVPVEVRSDTDSDDASTATVIEH
jgi:hypothetical protein